MPASTLLPWSCAPIALLLVCGAAAAQTAAPATALPPAPRSGLPTTIQVPELGDVRLPLPRSVRTANALISLSRQRLALVVGSDGAGTLAAAPRDTQAVAAALRAGGFVVMVREDLGADELRANLQEFRSRLEPGGLGFVYVTGLAAQVDGRNYLLPRGLALDGKDLPARLQSSAVPLQEIVDAVRASDASPRYLVVDAAYSHPALAALPQPGLAEQKVAPGTLALLAQSPGAVAAPPAADALVPPLPTDPRQLAASAFGRELVRALVTPRATGPEVLRLTRAAVLDVSAGKQAPVIVGDGSSQDEFAEPQLLEALFQRKPEEIAKDALQRATRTSSTAGEIPVGQLAPAPAAEAAVATASGGSTLANTALAAAGTAASVGVSVAGTAAVVAVGAKMAEAGAAASIASTAVGLAGSVATLLVGSAVDMLASAPAAPAAVAAATPTDGLPPATPRAAVPDSASATTAASPPPVSPPANAVPAATPRAAVPDTLAAAAPAGAGAMPVSAFQQAATRPMEARTQRQQDGGERPLYVPRVNPFGYAEGDTFTYRVLDTWKDQVLGTTVQSIEEVLPDGRLLANGRLTEMDPQGRIKATRNLDGSSSQFQPHQDLWWSDPKVGQRRDVRFDEVVQRADRSRGQTEWKGSLSVGKAQKIQLPAGEFDVLPIEGSGWFYEKTASGLVSSQWNRTVWYAPKLGHPVAIDIQDTNAVGKLLRRERVELTHAQTSRSP